MESNAGRVKALEISPWNKIVQLPRNVVLIIVTLTLSNAMLQTMESRYMKTFCTMMWMSAPAPLMMYSL